MELSSKQLALIDKHLDLVLQANKIHNLTTITDPQEAKIMHIEDSLAALEEIVSLNIERILDMGTGAGYPGIPLAIATNKETYLIESVRKKADCLNSFINKLELNNKIFVINDRIENFSQTEKKFDLITARALSSLSSLLELACPMLSLGSYLLLYKGLNIEEELKASNPVKEKLGYKLISTREYKLQNGISHSLLLYKKISKETIKLPRRVGLAQKKPLI